MKLKKGSFVFLTFLFLLFTNVAYALPNNSSTNTNVFFENATYEKTDDCKFFNVSIVNNQKTLNLNVDNLYPGAKFKITSTIKNATSADVKLIKVEFIDRNTNEPSKLLFANVYGYDDKSNKFDTLAYGKLLENKYTNTVIGANNTKDIVFELEVDPSITDLENTEAQFTLILTFEQNDTTLEPLPPVRTGDNVVAAINYTGVILIIGYFITNFFNQKKIRG